MKTLFYILDIFIGLFSVILRRLFKGRKRPNWTFAMEFTQMSMQKTLSRSLGEKGTAWFRNIGVQSSKSFKKSRNIEYQNIIIQKIPVVWFTPNKVKSEKIILYLHGGGYVYNSTATYLAFLNDICLATQMKIISVDYRLGPEHPFPAAHEDVALIYEALLKDYAPENIVLMGDSAGSALCTSVMLHAKSNQLPMPNSAVLISPWVNPYAEEGSIIENSQFDIGDGRFLLDCADKYLNGKNKKHPSVAPIFANLSGFPPILIQVGTVEMLLNQCQALAQKAKSDGVKVQYTEYEDLFHTALIASREFPGCPESVAEIVDFVYKH